jgi:AAA15 family ATPase/GTPase
LGRSDILNAFKIYIILVKEGGSMKKHIQNLKISSFRGIRELDLLDLADINIFVGDNNSGKTSVLEAIQILSNPGLYNLISVSRGREMYGFGLRSGLNRFESFMYMFTDYYPSSEIDQYSMKFDSTVGDEKGSVEIIGSLVNQRIDWDDYIRENPRLKRNSSESIEKEELFEKELEVLTFIGHLKSTFTDSLLDENVEFNDYKRPDFQSKSKPSLFPVRKVSPMDHIGTSSYSRIIDDMNFRAQAVEFLKEFEPNILDLRYIGDGRYTVVIETDSMALPLSVYGDGMKKVLTLLNALISSKSGVVLVDEIETSVHTSAMRETFGFFLETAKSLNVQLFLTTHSLEAVDKLLESAGDDLSRIRVIRLKNKAGKTYAKTISGTQAKDYRERLEMELRI